MGEVNIRGGTERERGVGKRDCVRKEFVFSFFFSIHLNF